MKRMWLQGVVATLALCAMLITGCAWPSKAKPNGDQAGDNKLKVVCATFPAYDWTRNIIGDGADRFDLTYLMGDGVDLHNYQPSVEDMARIADCDLFVYVGGETDQWARAAASDKGDTSARSLSLLDAVGEAAVEEQLVDGMQTEDGEEGADAELDEHVWLSLRNARRLVSALADEICRIDPEHVGGYRENEAAYAKALDDLDERYAHALGGQSHDTLVFADRFPFRYLVDDYGLNYYAAFAGCSAETEASFETVAFLANKVDELGLGSVCVIENSDEQIAHTVIGTTAEKDQHIVVVDSLQSVSDAQVRDGKTYLGTMEQNLDALSQALA